MDISKAINPTDLFSASGLVVVVTGGGSGIGLAYAAALARTNAKKVYILGRRLDTLKKAVESIGAAKDVVVPIVCDVTNPFTVTTAVQQIERESGYVDVLVNNAGVSGPDNRALYAATSIQDLQSTMLEDWPGWTKTFAINTNSIVLISAQFLHLLDAANTRKGWVSGKLEEGGEPRARNSTDEADASDLRTSQIITVASIAGFNRTVTAGLAYTSSKAAAVSLGKTFASLLAPWGIRSNIICPGIFPSEMTQGASKTFPYDKIPLGRQGTYDEMASTILSLVGRSGAYFNGNVTVIDGGRLSVMPTTY